MSERPRADEVLGSLKDFQRDTVEYVFERLYTADDAVKRFLVADEVGLGKTMVAKGVIAKAVEHLWEDIERIDVVYICSNNQIARQNLSRLNVVGGVEVRHADRLTLLPTVVRSLQGQKINFVSFTPGTSFSVGHSGGAFAERVLLYWMLTACWGSQVTGSVRWRKFFEGGMKRDNFVWHLKQFDRDQLDPELCASFGEAIDQAVGPGGGRLRDELEACAEEFTYLRGKPHWQLNARRNRLVGLLRHLVAGAAVKHLEPDLVILDEFQGFAGLLDPENDDDGAQLARAVFDHPDAKVLLLSATPYRMYTLPDEPNGDDHYRDFTRTVRFLAGEERTAVVEQNLRTLREALVAGGERDQADAARQRVEAELKRVMCRTERLSSTPDRDGMLQERRLSGVRLATQDLHAWSSFDAIARHVDRHDVFEYWRSAPYPLNLMEKSSYSVRKGFEAAADAGDARLTSLVAGARGLIDWQDVLRYQQIDPGNAKLRGLSEDVLDSGSWQLAWLPPSLPYYSLGGAYASARLHSFTKRLVFSAWTVVPKAISVMLSYEAERRTMVAAGLESREYTHVAAVPLQFRMGVGGRPAGMPVLGLLYPSVVLARLGDPLAVARTLGGPLPLDRSTVVGAVRERVAEALAALRVPAEAGGGADQRWYWAASLLLDRVQDPDAAASFAAAMLGWGQHDDDRESALTAHLRVAASVDLAELGPMPDDLVEVLTELALGGPGVCALRALSRVTGGDRALEDAVVRDRAYLVAQGLRTLFNKPEIVALVRAGEDEDEAYWRAVLDHAIDGGLQSVLDEYVHMLVESEGLQDKSAHERAHAISERMAEALSMRTAPNVVEDIRVADGVIRREDHRIGSHFAARYGRSQLDDKTMMRESSVRTSYNSPFRPFVLASTSVGQEGLDFHTYSHAIVHWNLPGNPVDLEQREGRVHRYKGHAVRKNVAADFGHAALDATSDDPWAGMFDAAAAAGSGDGSDITPFWVYTRPGGAVIERYVPAMPLSRESLRYERLKRSVGAYRMVIGQPRQDDLIELVGEDASWLQIDLTPPARQD